jgi:hypothetical protein
MGSNQLITQYILSRETGLMNNLTSDGVDILYIIKVSVLGLSNLCDRGFFSSLLNAAYELYPLILKCTLVW